MDSGMKVDPKVFQWWRVFAALKGMAIWISSSEAFHRGPTKSFAYGLAGWLATDRQQQVLLDHMSPHSRHRFPRTD
jgi:hypothetical protein